MPNMNVVGTRKLGIRIPKAGVFDAYIQFGPLIDGSGKVDCSDPFGPQCIPNGKCDLCGRKFPGGFCLSTHVEHTVTQIDRDYESVDPDSDQGRVIKEAVRKHLIKNLPDPRLIVCSRCSLQSADALG